jgi:hypothetical protein
LIEVIGYLVEFVAVFIGVIAAFELDKRRETRHEETERRRLLGLLRKEIEADVLIMDQILTGLLSIPNAVPYQSLRLEIWQGITGKLDIFNDDILLEKIARFYYRLNLLGRTLDIYLDHASSYTFLTTSANQPHVENLLTFHKDTIKSLIGNKDQGLVRLAQETVNAIDLALRD